MSMEHKAFAFDWESFSQELLPILKRALLQSHVEELQVYIETNLTNVSNPNDGRLLSYGWEDELEVHDVHEYGDYAITKYYDPTYDRGLGGLWMSVEAKLPISTKPALLGEPLGELGAYFDPGRMGAYFQTPQQVVRSLQLLAHCEEEGLTEYTQLLSECAARGYGVYVTF